MTDHWHTRLPIRGPPPSNINARGRFIYFPRLPAELRLQIWHHALCQPAIWAPIHEFLDDTTKLMEAGPLPSVTTKYLSPAPYLAGLSCREARAVLQETHVFIDIKVKQCAMEIKKSYGARSDWFHPDYFATARFPGGVWVHPDYTIVHIHRLECLWMFYPDESLRIFKDIFKHIMVERSQDYSTWSLGYFFPDIHNLITLYQDHFSEMRAENDGDAKIVSSELAAKYLAVTDQEEVEGGGDDYGLEKRMRRDARIGFAKGPQLRVYFMDKSDSQQDFRTWENNLPGGPVWEESGRPPPSRRPYGFKRYTTGAD